MQYFNVFSKTISEIKFNLVFEMSGASKKHSKALDEALEKSDQIEPRSPLQQVK